MAASGPRPRIDYLARHITYRILNGTMDNTKTKIIIMYVMAPLAPSIIFRGFECEVWQMDYTGIDGVVIL